MTLCLALILLLESTKRQRPPSAVPLRVTVWRRGSLVLPVLLTMSGLMPVGIRAARRVRRGSSAPQPEPAAWVCQLARSSAWRKEVSDGQRVPSLALCPRMTRPPPAWSMAILPNVRILNRKAQIYLPVLVSRRPKLGFLPQARSLSRLSSKSRSAFLAFLLPSTTCLCPSARMPVLSMCGAQRTAFC